MSMWIAQYLIVWNRSTPRKPQKGWRKEGCLLKHSWYPRGSAMFSQSKFSILHLLKSFLNIFIPPLFLNHTAIQHTYHGVKILWTKTALSVVLLNWVNDIRESCGNGINVTASWRKQAPQTKNIFKLFLCFRDGNEHTSPAKRIVSQEADIYLRT